MVSLPPPEEDLAELVREIMHAVIAGMSPEELVEDEIVYSDYHVIGNVTVQRLIVISGRN